jgi:methylmalonyl-CoA mutase N-terminal domain/subunit
VLGGTQSLHTNSFDEALGLPTEFSARIARNTQLILAEETGIPRVVDPLAGSYYVESLTSSLEDAAQDLIDRIDAMGGMVQAIESGWANQIIADASWEQQVALESKQRTIVGVNDFIDDDMSLGGIELHRPIPGVHERQVARLNKVKRERSARDVADALKEIERVAPHLQTNIMPAVEQAVKARATVGEICDVLRSVYGEHQPSTVF